MRKMRAEVARQRAEYDGPMLDSNEIDIQRLRWDDWNRAHISRFGHEATPEEVEYVIFSPDSIMRRTYRGRIIVLGPTAHGRVLAAVIDPEGNGIWYCVSARSAGKRERELYQEEQKRRQP